MGVIRGWMLKQRTETETIWENHGIPMYSKQAHRILHVGYGTHLMVTKRDGLWACLELRAGGAPEVILGKPGSRTAVEDICRHHMRAFPQG